MATEDSDASILTDRRMQLYGEPKDETNFRSAPKMMFSVYRGSPSIVLFTNDPNDQGQGPIRASLGLPLFEMFVQNVYFVADSEPGTRRTLQTRSQQGNQVQVGANVVVGKDDNGVVYCSVIQDDTRPKKRIPITPGQQIEIYDSNNQPLSEGDKSALFAKSFFYQISEQMRTIARETWQPLPQQNGGAQDNGGGGSSHVPGAQQPTSSAGEDDLPL